MNPEPINPIPGNRQPARRLISMGVIFGLGLLILLGGLVWHQLINSAQYEDKEAYQTYRRIIKEGARGNIFDRNGVLLAGNQPLFSVGVYLNELRAKFRERYQELQELDSKQFPDDGLSLSWRARTQIMQEMLDLVGSILGRDLELDIGSFQSHFHRRLILPYELCGNLSQNEYAVLIEQLPPESPIQIFSEPVRYYPFGSVGSHVIGYVRKSDPESIKIDSGSFGEIRTLNVKRQEGVTGLEKSLNAQLSGGIGWEVWSIDTLGFQVAMVDSLDPEKGSDLHTTLDIDLQIIGEAALQDKKGAIAAIDVQTGEVLALVTKPNYDLNQLSPVLSQETYDEIESSGAWLNRATQGHYPPGSTFKVITALAALKDQSYRPELEIYCGPHYTVGDRAYPENRTRGHGYIDLVRSLAVSSNVYFYQLGLNTGIASIAAQSRLLGLGSPTEVELPFESTRTLVPDREWKKESGRGPWVLGDTVNVSIGQGDLLVTPLQMARMTAAVAQRSEYLPVTILKGKNTSFPARKELALSSVRFDPIIKGMRECVEYGTGTSMQIPGLSIAAKTGTAQVFPGGIEENLAWVIAFAPVENPQIAVAVVIEDIESSDPIYGGSTAGPVAKAVIEAYFDK